MFCPQLYIIELGSVTVITDQTGTLLDEYKYDEFGMLTNVDEKSNINNPFKFTGAIHDKTANLYLMGSRYYNPKVGRFITQDSYGADFGADWTEHLYTYTDNDPVNFIDPTGHYKQGDEYLSMSAQNSIHDLENRWQYANKNKRKEIEKEADRIRAQERAKKNTKINKQGTGKTVSPKPNQNINNKIGQNTVSTKKNTSVIDKMNIGVRVAQSSSLAAGYSVGTDVMVSTKGVNVYGNIEGNGGAQANVDISNQAVFAYGEDLSGNYTSLNTSFKFGVGVDLAISWSDTSWAVAFGPSEGIGFQVISVGKGKTYKAFR
jgi:RHS repeat-associated protein